MHNLNISNELRQIAKGEVLSDDWSRKFYSVDASHYSLSPEAIICVKDVHDISEICKKVYSKDISITARGAGTGLLGQSLTSGILLDFTKYMNKIIELEEDHVILQPGIVKAVLDRELKKINKILPVDPSSSNYCTLGGMIANNSSGIHALGYGSTIDFLEQIQVVYSDGEVNLLSPSKISSFRKNNNDYYKIRKLLKLLSEDVLGLVKLKYPKVTKNSCGYRLDSVIKDNIFNPQKIFAASESTLGLISQARFRILDAPIYKYIVVVGFDDVLEAVKHVPRILKYSPSALELLDSSVIDYENRFLKNNQYVADKWYKGGSLLLIEFSGDIQRNVDTNFSNCKNELCEYGEIIETSFDNTSTERIWNSRRSALSNVMKITVGSRKPIGLIEDTVVKPNDLFDFLQFLILLYRKYKMDYVLYGHAGNGNIHTRPLIDITDPVQSAKMMQLANEVFTRVFFLSGTISGEHGDGLGRVDYISRMYGQEVTNIFKTVKTLFDPTNIMNPGKKVSPF